MDRLIEILEEIEDAECELEELNECGTLEERLEAARKVEDLRDEHLRLSLIETGGL